MARLFAALALLVTFAASACAGGGQAGEDMMRVTGDFGYRERIALAPGAVGLVTLSDVSRADASSVEIARQEIDLSGKSSPFAFTLEAPRDRFDPRLTYAVRATIRSSGGALLWTTDQVYQIDPTSGDQSVGLLLLKRVGG